MSPFPVFVINLKRDAERLDFMKRQLDKINIPFEAVPAVDGASIPKEQLEKIYDPELAMRKGRSLHPEEIGCWMSHIKVWRTMLERDLPAVLILEDDVMLADDFPEILRNLRLPDECQILQSVQPKSFCKGGLFRLRRQWSAVWSAPLAAWRLPVHAFSRDHKSGQAAFCIGGCH